MKRSNAPNLQRIAYHEGQLLSARDLGDDAAYESRLRGLHVRGLHNTWGVALGFEVRRAGNKFLTVGPGIAYDAYGREVISSHTFTLGTPVLPKTAAAGFWFDLVIGYRPDAGRAGAGDCDGAVNGEDRPVWRWRFAGDAVGALPPPGLAQDVRLGEDIPLVRCLVTATGAIDDPLDFTFRREAQGMVRPHLASGHLTVNSLFDSQQRAFSTLIDTSAGGFSQTPAYFARVRIPELLTPPPAGTQQARPQGPFVTIRNAGRTSFRLDVRFGFSQSDVPIGIVAMATAVTTPQVTVEVDWLGVEATGGCPPTLNLFSFIFLFLSPTVASQLVMAPGQLVQAAEGGLDG